MEGLTSQSFQHTVNSMMKDLVTSLHTVIDDLRIKLYDCFTDFERQKINASTTNNEKVMEFFEVVKTKQTDVHKRCLDAIEDLGYGDLASTLTKTAKKWEQLTTLSRPAIELEKPVEKCKECLKHCYLERMSDKLSTRWPTKLGRPTLYEEVTIVRAKPLSERFFEERAMGFVNNEDYLYVTIDKLLKDGYGKVIMIEGDPGAGKTTFTLQICKEWSEGKLLMGDIVLWIPLRHSKLVTNPSELFDKLGYPAAEIMSYAQQNNGKGLVLILDGWDELPDDLQKASLFCNVVFRKIKSFTHSTIIVTSRPSCSGEIAEKVEQTDSYYQILGFDRQKAINYIKAYFYSDTTSAELLLAFLDSNEYLCQHFYIPISVAIMCFVYRSDGKQIPKTLSRLYERFVVLCLRSNIPDACSQDLAKFKSIHDIPEKMKPLFHKLCKLAFDILKDKRLVLKEDEFKVMQNDLDNLHLEQFDGFGLLHVDHYTGELATLETSFSFIHRAVQELLAAIFISGAGNISDVLDEHFYKGSYLMNVFPFLFGLVSKEHLRPLAGKLIQIFTKLDRNDELLSSILFCLFEAHDETLCREFGQVFSEIKNINLCLRTLLDCHYACYFIAVCSGKGLNISMVCSSFTTSGDLYCEIMDKYLRSTSTDIGSLRFIINSTLSHKGMEQFAKTLSTQHNILSLKLIANCDPGFVAILCDSICKHNPQITILSLPYGKLNENDLESIGSFLTTSLSIESLRTYCSPSEGVCLDLSLSFSKALCETKSLQKLMLLRWSLSQADSEVFGNIISRNCSLKELCLNVATADSLNLILNGLSTNTTITTFSAWPSKISTSNILGQCLEKCLACNRSLNTVGFTDNVSSYVSWSSTQVISICTGLCANTTVVTLDISGCYINTEACNAVCGMLSQNKTLQHLFLNPVHLEKQEAIAMIDSCEANSTLELLSLVQWPPMMWSDHDQGKIPFQFSNAQEIKDVLVKIQKLRREKNKLLLNVYWRNDEYFKVKKQTLPLVGLWHWQSVTL